MTGRWRVGPRGERRVGTPWLVLRGDTHEGVLWNGPVLELRRRDGLSHLGPDILDGVPDLARFRAVPQSREIGEVLLDQRVVAGIGNMWKAEALWEAQVSPWRALGEVSDDELTTVLAAAHRSMRDSVEGSRPLRHCYRRAGRPCPRCSTLIRSFPQGDDARTAYWCPGCQEGGHEPRAV
jgi:endonuclease-8